MQKKWWRSFLVIVMFSLVFSWTDRTAAQAENLAFTSGVDYDFGQEMRFWLAAENTPEVTNVTLFFRAAEFSNAFSDTVPFTPGEGEIVVQHAIDLNQLYLAPFTTITYWWVLTTAVGEDIQVPPQTITYADDQFDWRTLSQSDTALFWTGDDAGLGQLGLDIIDESLTRLATIIPVREDAPLRVYIYPTQADLRAALRLTGRDWVGAHAHPELGVMLVTAVNPRTAAVDLRQSIPHELTHFLLYQLLGPNYDQLPAWFSEGLATYMETNPNPTYETILETAVLEQTTIPFNELCQEFPTANDEALLAYAQSISLIRFIQANYGNHTLQELISAFADGADCRSAVSRVMQTSLDELNQNWLRSQQPNSSLEQFWLDNGIWLLFILAGFGITSLLLIRR